jgi:hypothetical protein
MLGTSVLSQMVIQTFPKIQQIGQAERCPASRRFKESIGRQHIGQISRERALRSVAVKIEDPIGAPCLTTLKEFIARPPQRMKGMGYSEPATLIFRISCS